MSVVFQATNSQRTLKEREKWICDPWHALRVWTHIPHGKFAYFRPPLFCFHFTPSLLHTTYTTPYWIENTLAVYHNRMSTQAAHSGIRCVNTNNNVLERALCEKLQEVVWEMCIKMKTESIHVWGLQKHSEYMSGSPALRTHANIPYFVREYDSL